MKTRKDIRAVLTYIVMTVLSLAVLAPIAIILLNSFKGRFFIADNPFALPDADTFVELDNYIGGVGKIGFLESFKWSLIITVLSVVTVVLFTAMTSWYITRVKSKFTSGLYYLFLLSMIVPFQMLMFPMSYVANRLGLGNPLGIVVVYLAFGAGLSVFTFSGFIKSIPLEMEEAAVIDGCHPIQTFFNIVFPILKPTSITVVILNTMWIWNDYLLPSLILDSTNRTIPIAVQYLMGGYGSIDMGAMMAMLILAIVPIIVFYLSCQKYIIKGVISGAVKG